MRGPRRRAYKTVVWCVYVTVYSQVMDVVTGDDRCVASDSEVTEISRVQHDQASLHAPLPFGQSS